MTALNSYTPQPGSQPIIPGDRLANNSFDSFGPGEGDLRTGQRLGSLQWLASADPFSRATITAPPLQPSVAGSANDTPDNSLIKVAVDRLISRMEEGSGFGSRFTSETTFDSYGGDAEEWLDWSDLTAHTPTVPPQRPQSPRVASGFEASRMCTTTIPLADTDVDMGLSAIVIVPRDYEL